jgi:hypothetical protein
MMTLQKTVEIPADHRLLLKLDLPVSLPDGLADITLKIRPKMVKKWRLPFFRRTSIMDFYGCLKDSETFAGDSMDIQRKMRDEWPD